MSTDSDDLREELRRAVSTRYEVEQEIGRGGMSFVFQGRERASGRAVALKVLRREYASTLGPARFLREIRLHSQLHHPGILPLLDSGHSDNLFYFVMPLVEGETLEARLHREPQLTLDMVRSVVTQLAAALDYAHDAGVVHRDIKPSNLFLAGEQVLVADFGIAKDLLPPDGEITTSTDVVVGTVMYMSPEQADGRAHVDRRADVYSLGCVTYQMLAGEPPFTGPTTLAVIARVRAMPAPSARVLRPELPRGVDVVVRKSLAKSPADRYQRAGDFARALTDPAQLAAAARAAEAEEPSSLRARWAAGAVVALVAMALLFFFLPGQPLDPNKVVVFPLGVTPAEASQEGTGTVVALMIGTALEYTDPLEWIDGLPRLTTRLRNDANLLTAAEARRISRGARARWYLDGTVVRQGDSVTVVLRLNDARGDSVVGRASASRLAPEVAQAGLEAVNQLLPRLLAPGQRLGELSALADRRPAAVAAWLQGEREYRQFDFAAALAFQQRAVQEDSALAVAAIRGAQAAHWLNEGPEAGVLAEVAVRHLSLLPGRMAPFARGLHAYLSGQADSAVHWLGQALGSSPQWTEAHMALGEVYYHLLPMTAGPLDSLAQVEFTAAAVDSGFSPARFHLAELALRGRDTTRAKRAVNDFLRLAQDEASTDQRAELLLMLRCRTGGRKGVDWQSVAREAPLDALSAAKLLSGGGAFPGCAEDGFRSVFDDPAASLGYRWGALLGLQGILAAEGRTSELRVLVDSAVVLGLALANQLYIVDALAGLPVEAEAGQVVADLPAAPADQTPAFVWWLAGVWRGRAGDMAGLDGMRQALAGRARSTDDPRTERLVESLDARLLLLQGDSAAAVGRLRRLLETARQSDLDWGISQSLAPDRLLLAQLLLARGEPGEAIAVAAVFDHPVPAVFLPFVPASLELRRRAAVAMGQEHQARGYIDRLAALGATHQAGSVSLSSTAEAP